MVSWPVILVTTPLADQLLEPIGNHLARLKALAPPTYLPAPFNPLQKMAMSPRAFFGVALPGNWKLPSLPNSPNPPGRLLFANTIAIEICG